MRPERDIEMILGAWLAPGPVEMPDHLYDDVLRRIERVPQRRLAWTNTRFTSMFSLLKLPVAATVAALFFGLVILPLASDPERPPGATEPSPSASARPTVPVEIQSQWAAEPRVIEGLPLATTLAQWTIVGSNFHLDYQDVGMSSAATSAGPDVLRLESTLAGADCAKGDVGTYRWALSQGGTKISIEPIGDDCANRAAFLAGDWTNTGCDGGIACVGPLEPGRNGSAILDPRGGERDAPVARPGGLSYELPAGWASAWDWLSSTTLVPMEAFERKVANGDIWPDQISVWARPVAMVQHEPDCLEREDPSGGETVESLAAWLTRHPELLASEPVAIEIDGHPGLVIDIDMDPAAPNICPNAYGGFPAVSLFGNGFGMGADGVLVEWDKGWETDAWGFAIGGVCADCLSDPQRIILLDLDGDPLVILVDTEKAEDFEAFVEEAMPIVGSFEFPE